MRTTTQPRYRPLRNTETSFADLTNDDRRSDKQYDAEDANKIPVKSVVLAAGLLVIGSILLTLGALHLRGHIYSKDGAGWGLVTLGLLTFIPGFYQTRIAYHTWRGHPGFSYSSIPNY